ncbi:hypothetical protein FOMA001_g12749 [Fusarium oxysporum f. sp. matthiolae]|nr:hypothetical protein FOMA001_g12749 [Fusarium oxysporum f. sp. matthiolae]
MAQAIPQHPANQKMDPARVSLTPGNVQLLNPLEIIPYHTLKSKENADKWYQLYELFCRPIEGYAGRAAGQVRIAVLDTGIDKSMLASAFHENIKDNMSFLLADDAQDSGGLEGNHHGTQVVALLLSLAPWIHVYVARIGKDGDESMDPSCISKAIRYSVDHWDVHVISMSWGFRREHECISDAIRLAHSKDKIMFAAASNEGANLPARVTFPASMREVICVNSCDGYGNSSDFNPPPREGVFNFSTLGEAVIAKKSTLGPKRLTGTSFATPAAAAIAASILEFATQKQILKEQEELKRHIATKDGMMKLLVAMSEPVSGFMYLRPWDLIKCDSGTPNCSCKSCRKDAEARLLQILKRDLPSVAGRTPFLGLPDRISSAAFDAKSRQNTSSCLPNTRVKVLDEIRKWADSEDTRQVYWLKGMAGTGKSTIALTIAREYHQKGKLGGSFFFSRGHSGLAISDKFVATIASQLAQHSQELQARIQEAVCANPDISSKSLSYQWERLVLQPLALACSQGSLRSLLIVVDALDECEGDEDLCLLIRCLASCVPPGGHQLRILATSRPERPISLEFDSISTQERQHLVLHDVERSIVKEDLTEFYTHELNKINDRFGLQDLFCDTTISKMVQQSCGLFIYAAAVCRYIWQGGLDGAKSRLSGLVESKAPNSSPLQELDQLYTVILQNSIIVHSSHDSSEPSQWFRRVVGAIIVLSDTFSSASLCTFLGEGSLRPAIDNFHSVLNIPDHPEKPIGILHPSFRDFLLDPSRCLDSRFHINEQKAHQYLLDCCFRIMKNGLHYNMCNVDKPALRVHEISESFVRERIPYPVQYACRYWIHHLNHSGISSVQHVAITDFFRHCLLFWLETLAWTRNLVYAIEGVKSLRAMLADESGGTRNIDNSSVHWNRSFFSTLKESLGTKQKHIPEEDISSMVHDASRFLSMHGVIIEQAPLQIYSSALLFSPMRSITRKHYSQYIPQWVIQCPHVNGTWGLHLQTIKSENHVNSLAFSPNSAMLAVRSGTVVRLWDPSTGIEKWLPKQHSELVKAMCFSPNGESLATVVGSGEDGDEIRLWKTGTGTECLTIGKGLGAVTAFSFSPDGKKLVAAGLIDRNIGWKVFMWDMETGSKVASFGVEGDLLAAGFTSDGRLFAVQKLGSQINLLDLEDGSVQHIPAPLKGGICGLAISLDIKLLAIRTHKGHRRDDTNTWLWLASPMNETCRRVYKHYHKFGHDAAVGESLVFSPDGKLLAACVSPSQGYLIDSSTGKKKWIFHGPSIRDNAVTFSLDGRFLAVACTNYTSCVYDTANGTLMHTLKSYSGLVTSISFSPGNNFIATASSDKTVRLWEIEQEQPKKDFVPDPTPARVLMFSPDWELVVVKFNQEVQIRAARTGACLFRTDEEIGTYAFSPDGSLIAMLYEDRSVRILNYRTGKLHTLTTIPEYTSSRYTRKCYSIPMSFSAGGELLVIPWEGVSNAHIGGPVGSIRMQISGMALWEVYNGRISKLLPIDDHSITGFSFTLDGKVMITAYDYGFCMWDLQAGAKLWDPIECADDFHVSGVMALSPTSDLLAITCYPKTIQLWDLRNRTKVHCFAQYSGFLCFSPSGKVLASLSTEFSVTLWDLHKD